ncbi:hypothetical protein B0T13DRAFT_484005 [Neurospora crassa]|nr:hypothetical protein B0T13DRAFT_484005 [Neurospora crassa]
MNSSTPCLQFLRPYAWKWKPVGARNTAYLRFYHLARQHELIQSNALKYPRIRHEGGAPMRIPIFREKFKDVEMGKHADEEVIIHGRVQSVRRAGNKLMFLDLKGEFEHVQGLCNFNKLQVTGVELGEFKALAKLLNRGDIVSITGRATKTPTGELSIEATRLPELLTPALAPLPFKLEDEEVRIQHRHIDMLVNRKTIDTLRLRSHLIKYLRDFFHERGFLEFQTPILAENASGATARPFTVTASETSVNKNLAMRIAPELWLKRLVVGGVDKVFELGPAFRNEGIDQTHNPEFSMCEFYNAYANLDDLIALTEELICGAASHCRDLIATKLDSLPAIDMSQYQRPFQQLEFIPALESALGFKLPDLSASSSREDLLALLKQHKIEVPGLNKPDITLAKLLDNLASEFLEPYSLTKPLFITHHPVCMSPLSKSFVCPKTGQHVSARTELFINGKELANMYEEENDPASQRQKFVDQLNAAKREASLAPGVYNDEGESAMEVDESYVQALESGLPPTGGWGCGIERMVMLFSGTKRISDCLSFGNLRHVTNVPGAVRTGEDEEKAREMMDEAEKKGARERKREKGKEKEQEDMDVSNGEA